MTTYKPGLCVKFSYKVQNYEFSKSRSTDATSFSMKQERESATIYCSQEVEQGSSFQTTSFEWSWAIKECGNFFICIYIFNLFLTQPAPTWPRNVVSKSHTQMTLTWVSAAIIRVHKYWRTSSLLRKYHSSLEQGGSGGKLSSTGAQCPGMPGESWTALTQSVGMCPAAKPSCTYPLRRKRNLTLKGH